MNRNIFIFLLTTTLVMAGVILFTAKASAAEFCVQGGPLCRKNCSDCRWDSEKCEFYCVGDDVHTTDKRFKNLPFLIFRKPNLVEIFSFFKDYSRQHRPGLGDLATPIGPKSQFSLFGKRLWSFTQSEPEKKSKKPKMRFFEAPYLNGD